MNQGGGTVSGSVGEDHYEFGVLFVGGFRQQRPGSAIALLGAALYGWLYKWNSSLDPDPDPDPESRPVLSDVVLSSAGEDGPPAHMTLSARFYLARPDHDRYAKWLLAESSWTDVFSTPRFLGIARWIWKVSTCLLVMQFFVPMCRHWGQAKLPDQERAKAAIKASPAADRGAAAVYLVLMVAAAGLSVLFSALLLVLALASYLPIPRIDQAVRWVVVHISAVLGDTYMLAHCPVQFAAMRTRVARDLAWLQDHCDKVAIVAHSQGAAIVHRILQKECYRRDRIARLITLGQGITKFDLLWRMDWELCEHKAALRSRWLVTTGMGSAGLPAFSFVAGHWLHAPLFRILADFPANLLLIAVGLAAITAGVKQAMHTFRGDPRKRLGLKNAAFTWSDYYASADPVSNGPLDPSAAGSRPGKDADRESLRVPGSCNQVYNSGSVIFDHNGYLGNQDEFLTRLLNDLAAAAYPQDGISPIQLADSADEASCRRQHLIRILVIIRILTAAVLAGAWWTVPARVLGRPALHMMHLTTATAGMNNDASRFLGAVLIAAAVYITALQGWRYAMDRSTQKFFSNAKRPTGSRQPPPAPAEQEAATDIPATVN